MLGQNYEIVKPFIFEQPLEIIFSVIMLTAILVISFMISPISAITMMIVVPVCMFVSIHFGDSITKYSADNINDMKETNGKTNKKISRVTHTNKGFHDFFCLLIKF